VTLDAGKTPRESTCEMTEVVLPSDANIHGTVFGGRVMQWIDLCAAVAAGRHCRRSVVTASIDEPHFHSGIKVGHFAILSARLNGAFRTSMEISVEVVSEDPGSGERRLCTSALITFVAIAADGSPVPVPPLVPETEDDRHRMKDAEARRAARLAKRSEVRKK
jgi:acyl-CoA hydrolase